MEMNSAKTGSLSEAPSADADIARAEHSLSQMQPTSDGLSSALPNDVSPATLETPDKRDKSGTLPKLNADRQSAMPAADAGLGDEEEEKASCDDGDDAGGLPAIASVRSGL